MNQLHNIRLRFNDVGEQCFRLGLKESNLRIQIQSLLSYH